MASMEGDLPKSDFLLSTHVEFQQGRREWEFTPPQVQEILKKIVVPFILRRKNINSGRVEDMTVLLGDGSASCQFRLCLNSLGTYFINSVLVATGEYRLGLKARDLTVKRLSFLGSAHTVANTLCRYLEDVNATVTRALVSHGFELVGLKMRIIDGKLEVEMDGKPCNFS